MDVLLLHFNLERRDRRHRGYVLMEERVGHGIMETLEPVVEQNESTLSMDNQLEVKILNVHTWIYLHIVTCMDIVASTQTLYNDWYNTTELTNWCDLHATYVLVWLYNYLLWSICSDIFNQLLYSVCSVSGYSTELRLRSNSLTIQNLFTTVPVLTSAPSQSSCVPFATVKYFNNLCGKHGLVWMCVNKVHVYNNINKLSLAQIVVLQLYVWGHIVGEPLQDRVLSLSLLLLCFYRKTNMFFLCI